MLCSLHPKPVFSTPSEPGQQSYIMAGPDPGRRSIVATPGRGRGPTPEEGAAQITIPAHAPDPFLLTTDPPADGTVTDRGRERAGTPREVRGAFAYANWD